MVILLVFLFAYSKPSSLTTTESRKAILKLFATSNAPKCNLNELLFSSNVQNCIILTFKIEKIKYVAISSF